MNLLNFLLLTISAKELDLNKLFFTAADCINSSQENCNYMLKGEMPSLDYEGYKHLVLMRDSITEGISFISPEELLDLFKLEFTDKISINKLLVDKKIDKFIQNILDNYVFELNNEDFLKLYNEVDDEVVFLELEKIRKIRKLELAINYLPKMCPIPMDEELENIIQEERVGQLLDFLIYGESIVCADFAKEIRDLYPLLSEVLQLKREVRNFDPLFIHDYPEPDTSVLTKLKLWATHYPLALVTHIDSGIDVRDLKGNPSGIKLSMKDWCNGAMQGSMQVLPEEIVYSYAGVNDLFKEELNCSYKPSNRVKFRRVNWRYGLGSGRYRMVPYRSIAVDQKIYPVGTVFYIPEARGLPFKLSNTQRIVHDGYFIAVDAGGKIKGNHIDVFVGPYKSGFRFMQTSRNVGGFDAYVVTDPAIKKELMALHNNKF